MKSNKDMNISELNSQEEKNEIDLSKEQKEITEKELEAEDMKIRSALALGAVVAKILFF